MPTQSPRTALTGPDGFSHSDTRWSIMSESSPNYRPAVRSFRPVRDVLVIEPVQQHHGRDAILLPPGSQCSIGSSKACTLTVRAQGILPQHCLIVSGPNSTILKEFDEQTWLNDRPVREPLELMENDRLAVGPAEFRIRMANAEEIENSLPLDDEGDSASLDPAATSALRNQQARLEEEAAQLKSRERSIQERESELTSRFEELEAKLSELSGNDADSSTAAAQALDAQLRKLTEDGSLDEERRELELQRQEMEQRQAALAAKEEELKKQQEERTKKL